MVATLTSMHPDRRVAGLPSGAPGRARPARRRRSPSPASPAPAPSPAPGAPAAHLAPVTPIRPRRSSHPQRSALAPVATPPARLDPLTYRRRRILAAAAATLVVAATWIALQAIVSGTGGGPLTATGAADGTRAAARSWVVQPGDTLWGIALDVGVGGDIRPYVDALSAETGGRPLVPGERIALPPVG